MNAAGDPLTRPVWRPAVWFGSWLVLAAAAQVWLQLTFQQVGHPVSLWAANVEADPTVVRGWYQLLMENGTYLLMIRTEVVDLVWAVCLGVTLVAIYRLVGRLLARVDEPIARGLHRWAPLAALGPAFDLVENAVSLAMLTEPAGFPAAWAVLHATVSWLKVGCSIASAVVGPTLAVVALARGRARKANDARQAIPSR